MFCVLCACRTMYTYKMYIREQHKKRNMVFPFHRSPSFPFPIQFYMYDIHEENRFKRCIVCAKQVSRQDYRKTLRKCKKKKWDVRKRCVLENPSLLARVKHDFPDASETNRALPLAVCVECQTRKLSQRLPGRLPHQGHKEVITYRRPAYFVPFPPRNKAQFEHLLTVQTCGEGVENQNSECVLCHGTPLSPRQRENMLSKNYNSDCAPISGAV